jgi:hypothetical protein
MNFKAFYESKTKIGLHGWCEISDITSEDMFDPNVVIKVWSIIRHYRSGGETHYFLTLDKSGEYDMYDVEGNDLMPDQFDKSEYIDAVKKWEIKNNLTAQTKETFNDLIDEL